MEAVHETKNILQSDELESLVSIIMPNYNCGRFLEKTINSVICQTYQNWELLFVDDKSTDNSLEIVTSFNDERIIILTNEKNSGAAYSRNRALREAKGKWIAFLDSDDLWSSDKLEKQTAFMENNDYKFSYTKYCYIDEEGKDLNVVVKGPKKITNRKMHNYGYPGCLTVMYDREYMGLIQIECIKNNNDYAIWLKAIKKAPCYLLDEELAYYRKRSGSISSGSKLRLIKNHYILFRKSEQMNPIKSTYFMIKNLIYGSHKKLFYEKKRTNSNRKNRT